MLKELRSKAGLSRAELGSLSRVSDGTIKLIESGTTKRPEPETLRLLAMGLATNRAAGRVDPTIQTEMFARLMDAAGYQSGPPVPVPVSIGLKAELASMFGPDEAPLVAEILADWEHRTEGERKQILAALRIMFPGRPNAT
jgi:transcriptional regulator with XRE-family HTH domain